jgi:hypothetical protein
MSSTDDPTARLGAKLTAFAETLDEGERVVLHDLLHLAVEGAEVEGFAISTMPAPADPCEGGEVSYPGTINMLGNLHVKLHVPPRPRPR